MAMTAFKHLHECHANYVAINEGFNLLKIKSDIQIERFDKPSDLAKFHAANEETKVYSDDGKYCAEWYSNGVYITDLKDAMQPNKKLKEVLVELTFESTSVLDTLVELESDHGTLDEFMATAEDENFDKYEVRVYQTDAEVKFSPVAATKLERLAKLPRKWTHFDLMRVIANGQFSYFADFKKRRVTDLLSELEKLCKDGKYIRDITIKSTGKTTGEIYFPARKLHVDLSLGNR